MPVTGLLYLYLNFLEPSGPLQACNRTALPVPLLISVGDWANPPGPQCGRNDVVQSAIHVLVYRIKVFVYLDVSCHFPFCSCPVQYTVPIHFAPVQYTVPIYSSNIQSPSSSHTIYSSLNLRQWNCCLDRSESDVLDCCPCCRRPVNVAR